MPLVPLDQAPTLPADPAELARCLKDPMWRLSHLYKITTKGDDRHGDENLDEGDEGIVMHFVPNRAQRRFIARLWHRNLNLKARQLGFTTLACIMWLDHALFTPNQRCGIVAHNKDAAKSIFRDKVKFAYQNLPPMLLAMLPTLAMSADEILFANNSSIQVATSLRSGTYHRVLVSEYGKICAKYPDKAAEVKSGTLPAVPANGIAIIESTAEGQQGDFFKMTQIALKRYQLRKPLGVKDWRFHFFPWWQDDSYRLDSEGVLITKEDEDYFLEAEAKVIEEMGERVTFDAGQRAWYVSTRDGDFGGNEQTMWQEYPSYPSEAFKVSTEGTYYARELAMARKQGRIGMVPYMPGLPVHTFWDIGLNDLNAVWMMQHVGAMHHFINYIEGQGEPPSFYVAELQKTGYVWGRDFLPHDGAARRIGTDTVKTYEDMLVELGRTHTDIVPRIAHVTTGISQTRMFFPSCRFDEKNCALGLSRLQNYRKQWNTRLGTWSDEAVHDEACNGADAFRQAAQGYKPGARRGSKKPLGSWKTA